MSGDATRIDLGFVNAYLLKAEGGFVLLDAGMDGQWKRLKTGLEGAGCLPGGLRLVIVTHADRDHCGNCAALRSEYGAPIAVHRADAEALEAGESPKRTVSSLPAKLLISLLDGLRKLGGSPTPGPTCAPDLLLDDGQDLGPYGLAAKVLHLPGHTKGSIAVLAESGELYCGDVLGNRGRPAPSPFIESAAEYKASLERLRALAPSVRLVCPGHGAPFPAEALGRVASRGM